MTITAAPFRLDNPSFVVDHDAAVGAAAVQLKAAGRRIGTDGNQASEDIATFTNPGGEAPGVITEVINVEVIQSIGAGGLFNQLKPLESQLVEFAFLPAGGAAIGVDNQEMSGQCYVPFIPYIEAGVRKFSTFTLAFRIFGQPVFTSVAPAVYDSHA